MSGDFNNRIKKRIIVIRALMVASILLLCAKSFDIQILKGKELSEKAENDYSRNITIKGERGQILDQNMNKLGASIDAVTITACPAKINNPGDAAQKIADLLNINQKRLKEILSSKRMFAWVQRGVTPDLAEKIRGLNISGIYFENDSRRYYPNRSLAAQVIGFTGTDDSGLEGLECRYNSVLEGRTRKISFTRDGNGRILDYEKQRNSELKGDSIVLTIDKKIQFLSEQALEKAVTSHQAGSGMALVMKPGTGELLAIAHYPEFNPNNYGNYDRDTYRNRAVTDAFEPGSAMKVFTAAAALEKGVTPKTIIFCEKGTYRIGNFTIHDTHSYEWLTISQIIQLSSNIGAAKITESIGDKALYNSLAGFGFGSRTEIGITGETPGNLIPYKKWSKIDSGAISFGQGISVSALQLATGISAIANGGSLMKPLLVKKIVSSRGEDIKEYHPEVVRRVISPATANELKTMMNLVVSEEGTGTKASIDGYEVCGKTGTAQKASGGEKGYARNKYISVFVGFAPLENPELAVLVIVDEPQKQYYGGDVAAPAFKTIMAESFNYLNIAPGKNKNMVARVSDGGKN
ncbi:MAG: cell division protein FtsI [Desulfobacterales bacterium RIFOXYA12_FULL_46_15]|nr:MAG: cell division protein FtsI [Desulfobacterales bacterium RIFOXYA12_FULL_46_15]